MGRRRGLLLTSVVVVLACVVAGLAWQYDRARRVADPTVVTGTVTDSSGEPVVGARVWALSSWATDVLSPKDLAPERLGGVLRERQMGTLTTTDADGAYRIRLPEESNASFRLAYEPVDEHHLWSFGGGAAHVGDAEWIGPAEPDEVVRDVVLMRPGVISGTVSGAGVGVRGWSVAAIRVSGGRERVVRRVALRSSTWTLDGLAPGTYVVRAASPLGGVVHHPAAVGREGARMLEVTEDGRIGGIDVELLEPGRVEGRVVDASGRALGDVDVFLVRRAAAGTPTEMLARRRTDEQGRWTAPVPAGDYSVHLHAPPKSCFTVRSGPVRVGVGATVEHEMSTESRARISGRVTMGQGMSYAGLSIRPVRDDGNRRCQPWLPDVDRGDGSFDLTGVPRGTYRMDFVDPNGMEVRAVRSGRHSPERFTVRDGKALTDFDVRLERAVPRE